MEEITFGLWSITMDGVTTIPLLLMAVYFIYYTLLSTVIFSVGFCNDALDKNLSNTGVTRPITFSTVSFFATASIATTFERIRMLDVQFSASLLVVLIVISMLFMAASVSEAISQKLIAISYGILVLLIVLVPSIEFGTLIFLVPTAMAFIFGYLLYKRFGYQIVNLLTNYS